MRFYLIFISVIGLASCRCTAVVECTEGNPLMPCFSGFQPHELDTIIAKIYKPGTNFTYKIDSFFHDASNDLVRNSNSIHCPAIDLLRGKALSNDFEIIVPGAGKSYRFSELTFSGPITQESNYRCDTGPTLCYRPLASYRLNGELKAGDNGMCILKKE